MTEMERGLDLLRALYDLRSHPRFPDFSAWLKAREIDHTNAIVQAPNWDEVKEHQGAAKELQEILSYFTRLEMMMEVAEDKASSPSDNRRS